MSDIVTFTAAGPRRLRCPKCGAQDQSDHGASYFGGRIIPRISVSIEPYSGDYCQTCYARWLSENIPRLEVVPLTGRDRATGERDD